MEGQGRNLIQFAFWSGLRTFELVALEWGDVDRRRGLVCIRRGHTQPGAAPEEPKTRAGARDVELLPPALAAIKDQKQRSLLHLSGWVFVNPRPASLG
jgi:integrase